MDKLAGWKHEGRAHYSICVNGEVLESTENLTAAQPKLEKEVNRATIVGRDRFKVADRTGRRWLHSLQRRRNQIDRSRYALNPKSKIPA